MNIKDRILNLMADGKERHYRQIAKTLKIKEASTAMFVQKLRQQGLLETPVIIIKKKKCGFYRVPSETHKGD